MRWSRERGRARRRSRPAEAPANSARSDASCAIFVPDGVTRWSKSRAAIVAAAGRERLDRPLEVIGHDLSRAAEPLERRGPQRRRTRRALDVPDRCMTSWRYGASMPRAPPFASTRPEPPGPSSIRPAPTPSSTRSTSTSSVVHCSPSSSLQRSSGRTIAARPAARSSRSRRRTFANRLGMSPLSRSSVASVSSRSDRRTLTRSGRLTSVGERRARSRPPSSWYVKYSSAWSRIR